MTELERKTRRAGNSIVIVIDRTIREISGIGEEEIKVKVGKGEIVIEKKETKKKEVKKGSE